MTPLSYHPRAKGYDRPTKKYISTHERLRNEVARRPANTNSPFDELSLNFDREQELSPLDMALLGTDLEKRERR